LFANYVSLIHIVISETTNSCAEKRDVINATMKLLQEVDVAYSVHISDGFR
jgi:hypothetical protein